MIARRYPQLWLWLFCLLAWLFMLWPPGEHTQSLHHCHHGCGDTLLLGTESHVSADFLKGILHWSLMIVAMMFPLLKEPLAYALSRYPSHQGYKAMVWFLLGYCIPWLVVGLLLQTIVLLLPLFIPSDSNSPTVNIYTFLPFAGFAIAAFWVWSPWRRKASLACSRTIPMRIQGWYAVRDCLHYGHLSGIACVRNCWSPMMALVMAQHNMLLMFIVTLLLIYERTFLTYKSHTLGYAWACLSVVFFLQATTSI